MGGKLGLLEQGPAAARPSQKSGTYGLSATASERQKSGRITTAANGCQLTNTVATDTLQTPWLKAKLHMPAKSC
jgi:hypothetical protein